MTPPNELELKRFLAERLPERISIRQSRAFGCSETIDVDFFWKHTERLWEHRIKETEWLAICAMVEGQLDEEQLLAYEEALWSMWSETAKPNENADDFRRWLIRLDYQNRAEALRKVLG